MNRRSFITVGAALAAATSSPATAVDSPKPSKSQRLDWLRFDHVSIQVAEFDKMVAWYQDTLGFKLEVSWRVQALNGKQLAYLSKNGT